jgi:hypothetical protein
MALHVITYTWDSGDPQELAQGSCLAELTDEQATELRAMLARRLDGQGNGEEYSVAKQAPLTADAAFTLIKEELQVEDEQCSGDSCKTIVTPDDPYYATPCGTYCGECMKEHAKDCEICRKEFDLEEENGNTEPG